MLSQSPTRSSCGKNAGWFVLPIFIVAMLVVAKAAISPYYDIYINKSESLPGVVFILDGTKEPRCGDTVFYTMPKTDPYYGGRTMIKELRGCPGDVITVRDRNFYVNGIFAGRAKLASMSGSPLKEGKVGEIPADHFYVWAPHYDSYDSRYSLVGWLPRDHIIGKAIRVI